MKDTTPLDKQTAFQRLAALCARAEHCQWEMTEKMRRWHLDDADQAQVMERLLRERYVDDERYARAFVLDKVRYNRWGPRKVEQALWQKHIDEDIRRSALAAVDDALYADTLRSLLQQKRRSLRAADATDMNRRLLRFALSRGFTYDIIRRCLDVADELEY